MIKEDLTVAVNTIDAKMLAKMFLAGAKNLESKKEWINELNVFPVPDGDTGTNMTLTIMSAAKDVAAMNANNDLDMKSLAKAISSGSLRGARGNSGVILSQLFRGFTKAIRDYDTIDIPLLAEACEKAVETAYKAVMKPKEGTILTVAKGIAEKAAEMELETDDLEVFIPAVIEYAVCILGVKHIIVCGHSHCGACKSLYHDLGDSPDLINIKKWLDLGKRAKEYTLLAIQDKSDPEKLYRATERISIVHQMENLLTFPYVERKVKNGELQIHGWYHRIEDGSIEYYDGEECTFKELIED